MLNIKITSIELPPHIQLFTGKGLFEHSKMSASSIRRNFKTFDSFIRLLNRPCVNQNRILCLKKKIKYPAFRNVFRLPWLVAFPLVPTVEALGFGWGKSKDQEGEKKNEFDTVLSTADRLYESNKVQELYDYLLQYKNIQNAEILWRLARATCDKGKCSRDNEQRKLCMFEAFEYAKGALILDENSFACNKWYAILLDYTAEYEGTKARILNSYKVKDHFLKAIELNPKDATSVYSLGYWCFVFADLPWYQRKLASTLLATPPSSTYEEALKYFLLAEKVEPNFYSMNLLMLGKTYYRMGDNDSAKRYLIKARDYPVQTTDDEQAHKEAVDLLQRLGVNKD